MNDQSDFPFHKSIESVAKQKGTRAEDYAPLPNSASQRPRTEVLLNAIALTDKLIQLTERKMKLLGELKLALKRELKKEGE